MSDPRFRPLAYAAAALVLVWALVWGGFRLAENSKVTLEKVLAYVNSVDLARQSAAQRAKALHRLEAMINALSPEERRRWRMDRLGKDLFGAMTEGERGEFIEATMPTGFKQMLDGFAELPEEKRKKFVDDALKNLRQNPDPAGKGQNNGQQPLSPELEQKVRTIGLKTFFTQASPQTKAELAPLVEELQHQLQSGRGMR